MSLNDSLARWSLEWTGLKVKAQNLGWHRKSFTVYLSYYISFPQNISSPFSSVCLYTFCILCLFLPPSSPFSANLLIHPSKPSPGYSSPVSLKRVFIESFLCGLIATCACLFILYHNCLFMIIVTITVCYMCVSTIRFFFSSIWLCWVLVVACGLFYLCFNM